MATSKTHQEDKEKIYLLLYVLESVCRNDPKKVTNKIYNTHIVFVASCKVVRLIRMIKGSFQFIHHPLPKSSSSKRHHKND